MKKLTTEQKLEVMGIIEKIGSSEGQVTQKNPLKIHKTRYEDWSRGHKQLTEQDFIETQKVLQILGYKIGAGEEPVHIQFNKKHNL